MGPGWSEPSWVQGDGVHGDGGVGPPSRGADEDAADPRGLRGAAARPGGEGRVDIRV
jgi:hypothetical protein